MPALEQQLAHLGAGAPLVVVLATALLLGLRHATDPDHLAAPAARPASDCFALARGPILRGTRTLTPALALISLLFGAWYTLGALAVVPYPL